MRMGWRKREKRGFGADEAVPTPCSHLKRARLIVVCTRYLSIVMRAHSAKVGPRRPDLCERSLHPVLPVHSLPHIVQHKQGRAAIADT
eukprot:2130787-Rhodomonas_salina.1